MLGSKQSETQPPDSDDLMQRYRQEEDSDYAATLLVLFIDSSSGLKFHSIEHDFPNSAKPDVACEYSAQNGALVFEIKSKREMNSVAVYEIDHIVKQIIRYSTSLSGWSLRLEEMKQFCDVIIVANSHDVQQLESDISSKLGSLDGSNPKLRSNGLAFCGWERTEVIPADELKVRLYKGTISDDSLLTPLREFNGYHKALHEIARERNERNIHLEIQSEHRLMILIMEKVWGIYDFRTTLRPKERVKGTAAEDYFVEKGRIYFTLECLDFHFHWVPSGRAYCSKVKRDRLRHACEQMVRIGFLDKQEVGGRVHYGLVLNRKQHDYLTEVCRNYAKMLEDEYELEQSKRKEILSRGQRELDSFPSV